MEIFVKTSKRKTIAVYLGTSDRLQHLKAKIKAVSRLPSDFLRASRPQNPECEWGCTDSDGFISEEWLGYRFVDLEKKNALQRIPIHCGTGRRWSRVFSGLNIEGKCTNTYCEAFGKGVISPQDLGSFNTTTDKAPCPLCRCSVKATTCGFVDCQWMYTGRKKGSEVGINSEWQLAGDEYVRFRETGNVVDWEVLIISTKENPSSPDCHMCLRAISLGDEKEHLTCGCQFHSNCVAEWKKRETGCPNCRPEESTSQRPVELRESKPKRRKSLWRLCQG